MSAEYFRGLGTESNGIVGTFAFWAGAGACAETVVAGGTGENDAPMTSAVRTMKMCFTGPS
jgi:hypothetical protein